MSDNDINHNDQVNQEALVENKVIFVAFWLLRLAVR